MKSYEELTELVDKNIKENHSTLVALNDDIADHPEVSTKEYETSKKMVKLLREKGFEVEYPFAGLDTSYKAVYGPNNHKHKVAILTEYDALPEIGHACGHCLSGSISLLAGISMKDLQDELDTDIHIIGTPDEEFDGGKVKMIRAGAFDGYEMAMMIHMHDSNKVFTKLLALDTYTYYFHGFAAHSSECPWNGRNALNAAQLMLHAVDMLRQHVTPDVRMHGVIRNGGEAPNIVPEEASIEIYLRALERENLNEVTRKVDDCAKGAAIATQTTWEKKATAEVYDDLKYLPFGCSKLKEVYEELGLEVDESGKIFGSSDCGNVSKVCPVFHSTLQVVDPGVKVHTRPFEAAMKTDRAHQVLETGAKAISRQIIKIFSDEENIKKLREEWESATL